MLGVLSYVGEETVVVVKIGIRDVTDSLVWGDRDGGGEAPESRAGVAPSGASVRGVTSCEMFIKSVNRLDC
jgi:hypothetical protein